MKRLSIVLVLLTIIFSNDLYGQAPEKMSYQAVIRNATRKLIRSTSVGVEISVLKGSATGNAVYVERHTTTTSADGVATLQVGTGTPITGTFGAIDWASGPYFLKTNTDPVGGTNYIIAGTAELLSVPYALYAKSSGSGGGTTLTAGDGIEITNNEVNEKKYKIGDFAQGGVIFWVDETGEHGLVVTKTDQSTGVRWHAGTAGSTQAKGDGTFAGEMNTAIIIAAHVAIGDDGNTYAARICNELLVIENSIGYGDWYLPSIFELGLIYSSLSTVNAAITSNQGTAINTTVSYWSSTEGDAGGANGFAFGNGSSGFGPNKGLTTNYVRAIRAF
ncbi:MAG: DUF1566 domain-containing protein [Aureispira sp.]|nr:DUF1566 domain-containing protein [Aureispira sp.]